MPKSLILIPDISGFTEFVNNTEITHSQHIISELLELIINSNELNMLVAEIEGDAVLFVKEDSVPTVANIISQAENMFLQFHRHLQQYESQRICNCGACSNAYNLSLKIIVHASEIGFTLVNKFRKPFGPAVITAHRLLKNSIPEKEYVLFSDAFFTEIDKNALQPAAWIKFTAGVSSYEEIGDVNFKYISLKKLKDHVHKVEPLQLIPQDVKQVVFEGIINKPVYDVFEILSNLDYRVQWNNGINELVYDKNRVNRAGTKHVCIFSGSKVEIETIKKEVETGKLIYGERLIDAPIVKDISFYWILENAGNSTKVRIEVFIHPNSFLEKIFLPFIRLNTKKISRKNFNSLKTYCETDPELQHVN
jgi:hypothetical protein